MFNFNKKTNGETKSHSYPQVVEDIHNEFYAAGESIVAEANLLLSELAKKDSSKGKRLSSLGFIKTPEAVSAIENEMALVSAKNIASLVEYYKANYPNNKFITDEQVKVICEKYGLVLGDTSMYKGFVPEVKLQMIENFKLKEKEKNEILFEITESHNGDNVKLPIYSISSEDLSEHGLKYFKRDDSLLDYFYIVGERGSHLCKKEVSDMFVGLQYVRATRVVNKLKIVAPLKDMEIPSGKRIIGHEIKNIPDPIVLQNVRGGYLIVCAWGDEASDDIVVDNRHN
jgi:hypothetical protein